LLINSQKVALMLPDPTLPPSLMGLLAAFEPLFTAPSFRTFCALAAGFLAQTGRRTVCGMLTAAGLAGVWRHQRAHRFFSAARWSSERLGLALAKLTVSLLVPDGEPVTVAVDDTLFKRTGKKVHAIGWFHDGSAKGPHQVGLGNNWVICAVIVRLPFLTRPVALPVLARLVHKDLKPAPASRLVLARQMAAAVAGALPGREVHVVADAAYAGKELRRLPATVTWTTRLRKDAALYELPGPRTGRRGRPRVKGARLPSLNVLAGTLPFTPVTVRRYGKTATVQAAAITCLWHGVFGARPVQVVLVREHAKTGYDVALATTDPAAAPAQVIERYASRWSIEVAVEDAKQVFGAGQARNRLAPAVHRTIPFTPACQSIAILWYAISGHHPADVADRRVRAPWYTTKAEPSTADMAAKLRRVLIAAKYRPVHPSEPTPAEIHAIRLAWDDAAA
jgi:DDE superfamily endonuclease